MSDAEIMMSLTRKVVAYEMFLATVTAWVATGVPTLMIAGEDETQDAEFSSLIAELKPIIQERHSNSNKDDKGEG